MDDKNDSNSDVNVLKVLVNFDEVSGIENGEFV
jgi:hypothetical protein